MITRTSQRNLSNRNALYRSVAKHALCLWLFLMAGSTLALGQKTCIPPVQGVPGFSNARPNWWDSTQGSPDYQPALNPLQPFDPRWIGAASYDYGSGTLSDAEFLAESNVEGGQTVLYLSWYVKGGPLAPITQTATTLYVGFMPNASSLSGTIIEINLNKFTGTDSSGIEPQEQGASGGYYSATVYTGSGTTSWNSVTTPSWLTTYTGVWAFGNSPNNWAIEMRIPIDSTGATGINTGSNGSPFNLWYALQPSATVSSGMAVVPYTMPKGATPIQYAVQLNSSLQTTYPDPSTWASFQIKDPTTDPTCLTGVYLSDDQIGTQNAVPSNMNLTGTNTFYAKPYNYSTSAVGSNVLTTTFYLANWGAQIGDLTSSSWTSPPSLTSVPAGGLPGGIPAYSGSGTAPQGNLTGSWTMSAAEACAFTNSTTLPECAGAPAPTKEPHQCMMVKLNGPGLTFSRASAFRNMDFVSASTFSREADISVAGLGPIHPGATKRDVYLYVETLNMPKEVPSGFKSRLDGLIGEPGKRTTDLARVSLANRPLSEIVQTVPIYIVRAYYDTGYKLNMKDGKHIVLQPETSFGYYVIPHSDVTGWVHSLHGATEIAPNWYRLEVANDTASHVTTSIEAIEPLPGISGCLANRRVLIVLLLIGLLLLALLVFRPWEKKV